MRVAQPQLLGASSAPAGAPCNAASATTNTATLAAPHRADRSIPCMLRSCPTRKAPRLLPFATPVRGCTLGGTRVKISGAAARARRALAVDPEHWSDALGASPAAQQ